MRLAVVQVQEKVELIVYSKVPNRSFLSHTGVPCTFSNKTLHCKFRNKQKMWTVSSPTLEMYLWITRMTSQDYHKSYLLVLSLRLDKCQCKGKRWSLLKIRFILLRYNFIYTNTRMPVGNTNKSKNTKCINWRTGFFQMFSVSIIHGNMSFPSKTLNYTVLKRKDRLNAVRLWVPSASKPNSLLLNHL